MTQECAELALADMYTRSALASLRYMFMPGRETAEARRNAWHMNLNFGLLSRNPTQPGARYTRRRFSTYISQLARAASIGWRSQAVEFDWYRDTAGQYRYFVRDLVDLPPQFHNEFVRQPGVGLVGEINSWTGQQVRYPATHLNVLTIEQEGTNMYGNGGLLYPCRKPHTLDQLYYRLIAVGGEKWALFTPIMNIDREAARRLGYAEEDVDAMIDDGYAALAAYVGGDSNVLIGNPAVSFSTYGNPHFDPMKLDAIRKSASNKKLRAYLLNLLAMGSNDQGNRSVGDHLKGAHQTLLIGLADAICEVMSGAPRRGVAAHMRALDMSYGPQHPLDYPVLWHFGLKEHPGADLLPHVPHWLLPQLDLKRREPGLYRGLLQLAGIDPDDPLEHGMRQLGADDSPAGVIDAEPVEPETGSAAASGRMPRMANTDPSAGGPPARPGV